MTAPRVSRMCMYGFSRQDGSFECGLFRRIISDPDAHTCPQYQIGYYGRKYEAEQERSEMIERERRRAEAPVQLDLFGDGAK
jgi:hypothetical protein